MLNGDGVLALGVAAAIALVVVPMPTALIDGLLALQLGASITILLAALAAPHPLSLSSFPRVLLLSTLLRLALNVSTTRLILSQGDAGSVVAAFGDAVIAGNLVVGAVVFGVITLVQYLVIARGAERVAQVGARFALDALPGQQLAIDADLRAGELTAEAARTQRATLIQTSSLYGAMDGAMKFVRGDAVAGLAVVGINVIGGLAVGLGQRGMSVNDALELYTRLTIGDGLVSQLPAMLTATAAALVVTRVSTPGQTDLARAMGAQLAGRGRPPAVAGALLLGLSVLPGLPGIALAVVGLAFLAVAVMAHRRPPKAEARVRPIERPPMALSVVLSANAAALLGERGAARVMTDARDTLRASYGVHLPEALVVSDAHDLPPGAYRIEIGERAVAWAELHPGVFACPAAKGSVEAPGPNDGPTGGWISAGAGLNAAAYLTAHLVTVWRRAPESMGMQEVADRLAAFEVRAPALVRAATRRVELPRLAALLRRLLAEGVSVQDLGAILEALAQVPSDADEAAQLAALRRAMAKEISARFAPDRALEVVYPSPSFEAALRRPEGPSSQMVDEVVDATRAVLVECPAAVLLMAADVRGRAWVTLKDALPGLPVLSVEELGAQVEVQMLDVVGD